MTACARRERRRKPISSLPPALARRGAVGRWRHGPRSQSSANRPAAAWRRPAGRGRSETLACELRGAVGMCGRAGSPRRPEDSRCAASRGRAGQARLARGVDDGSDTGLAAPKRRAVGNAVPLQSSNGVPAEGFVGAGGSTGRQRPQLRRRRQPGRADRGEHVSSGSRSRSIAAAAWPAARSAAQRPAPGDRSRP